MKVKKAMIPCAGFGTRFLPATRAVAKELFPIVDTPALFYILKEAEESGIEEVLIILSERKRQAFERLFEEDEKLNASLVSKHKTSELKLANARFNMKISFVTQPEMTGNGAAIALGEEFACGEPFAVLFGDDVMDAEVPVTKQLMLAYERTNLTVVGCQNTSETIARKCGVMKVREALDDRTCLIDGIVEKPEGVLPSGFVSLGRFILTPDIFDAIRRTKKTEGEIYLTDAIGEVAKTKGACAYLFDARRYDIGDKEGYLEATVDFALKNPATAKAFKEYLKNLKGNL